MKITHIQPDQDFKEIPVSHLGISKIGIVTRVPRNHGEENIGKPCVYAGNSIAFLGGNWSSTIEGYYCRQLRKGEKIIIEGDE